MKRRDFLQRSAAMGAGLGLVGGWSLTGCADTDSQASESSDRALRILVLGGTGFIGPHTIRYAQERGHTVSMFNRGRTRPELFPNVESLIGDRNDDLTALEGREWDVVIDNHATNPRWVRDAAQLLTGSVGHYVFISTLSVYADNSKIGTSETDPTFFREDVDLDAEADDLDYGTAKSIAENEAEKAFPGRTTVIRPGLIVGPGDPTDRFSYWPIRIQRGGEVLAPGDGSDPTQFIDARDLTGFVVRMAEAAVAENPGSRTFNAVGPNEPMPMNEVLDACVDASGSDAAITWVPADFLASQQVRPWSQMPLWVPPTPEMVGFSRFSIERALAAGIAFRPVRETITDLLEWHGTRPEERRLALRAGLSPEREQEVLAAWHARNG